ncbi:MAG: hypothetical protein E6Q97_36035 [Desulfurellales bacterium]|nr:MAG: hypothetical protein E6Q97_36035 [Desulfurellales bacterium]
MARFQRGAAALTAAEVQLIRRQGDDGTIDVQGWARAKGVSAETIRKVYRRETYNSVPEVGKLPAGEMTPVGDLTDDEAAASLERLRREAGEVPPQAPQVNDILDEIQGKGKNT